MAPTFSITLLCWDQRSETVRKYPTFVVMLFYNIFLWRNASCGWSTLKNQLIYGANAWASVWSQICSSFGENLIVFSFIRTICGAFFISKTVKIYPFECRDVKILISWWSLGMIFTLELMLSFFSHHLNPFQIHFPYFSSSGLITGRRHRTWSGQCTGAQALRFMTALISMSHWVSQAMSRRLALLFPPFPWVISVDSSSLSPSPPLKLQKSSLDSSTAGL